MPRFHFHIRDDDGIIPDHEGSDCPDLLAAFHRLLKPVGGLGDLALRKALLDRIEHLAL